MQADASEAAAKAELAAVTKQAIDAFDAAFREAYDGAKPTWDARAFGVMQSLVVKHSIAEVLRRMSIMFTAPPRWPPPPYNLQSFSMHFDRFANPTSTGGVIDRGRGGENYYGPVTEVTRG